MLQSILESSCHGLNRFLVDLEEKRKLGGVKGDPKKSEIFAIFLETPYIWEPSGFFSGNFVTYLDKAWSELSKDSFRSVLLQLVEVLWRFKVARGQNLEKSHFFGFLDYKEF